MTSINQYLKFAIVAQESALKMHASLDWMKLDPQVILDLGCGPGQDGSVLKKRYPKAKIVGVDLDLPFLCHGKEKWGEEIHWICADAEQLPIKEYKVDLIFANLLLPWCQDIERILQEWRRILKPGGLFVFTALGLDALQEIAPYVDQETMPYLQDMHDIGDALLKYGFLDPVLEREHLILKYKTSAQLTNELKAAKMLAVDDIMLPDSIHSLTYEVIFGHAFSAPNKGFMADDTGTVNIPLSSLRKNK